jgi:Ca2+-transporting ATPase
MSKEEALEAAQHEGLPSELHAMHDHPLETVVRELHTDLANGLSPAEVQRRLAIYGPNQLAEGVGTSFWQLVLDQFKDFLVLLLLGSAAISIVIGETVDAVAILAIVVINAILGVLQEWRAEKSLQALKRMAAPTATVIRDGHQDTIPAGELVPGDVVLLAAGNNVPADLRLIETVNLRIQEASLTGESVPVEKNALGVLDADIPVGDRSNSAFMGTVVAYGRGKGIVTSTGMHTQFGLIAQMLTAVSSEETPLQRRLEELGKVLGTGALAICGIIFVIGVLRDTQPAMALSQGLGSYLSVYQKQLLHLPGPGHATHGTPPCPAAPFAGG